MSTRLVLSISFPNDRFFADVEPEAPTRVAPLPTSLAVPDLASGTLARSGMRTTIRSYLIDAEESQQERKAARAGMNSN